MHFAEVMLKIAKEAHEIARTAANGTSQFAHPAVG